MRKIPVFGQCQNLYFSLMVITYSKYDHIVLPNIDIFPRSNLANIIYQSRLISFMAHDFSVANLLFDWIKKNFNPTRERVELPCFRQIIMQDRNKPARETSFDWKIQNQRNFAEIIKRDTISDKVILRI